MLRTIVIKVILIMKFADLNFTRLLGLISLQDVLEAFKNTNMPKKSVIILKILM